MLNSVSPSVVFPINEILKIAASDEMNNSTKTEQTVIPFYFQVLVAKTLKGN